MELRRAIAILRNRTDLIASRDAPQDNNIAALWEAVDLLAQTIERPAGS